MTWKMPGSSWIERLVVPAGSGSSPTPAMREQKKRSPSTGKRWTVAAFGSTARKKRNDLRAEDREDGRLVKVADVRRVADQAAASIAVAADRPEAEHQLQPAIVIAVTVIATEETAEVDATAVVTSATTGVAEAAAIVAVVARAAALEKPVDDVAVGVEPGAAARVGTDRRTVASTTTSTISTTS